MKSEKGYTLITLILGMFLLLILACISIALLVTADQEEATNPTPTYIEDIYENNSFKAEENEEVTKDENISSGDTVDESTTTETSSGE